MLVTYNFPLIFKKLQRSIVLIILMLHIENLYKIITISSKNLLNTED